MPTTNKILNQPAYDSANWDVPLNANFGYIDQALGSTTSIPVAGVPATPVVLTDVQYRSMSIAFSGLLGNNVTYQIPSGVGGTWSVFNDTTGAFTVTIDNVAVGSSVVIPQGNARIVISDGTNIKFPGSYGTAGQVLYSDSTGVVGDTDFTFASDILSVPRVRTGDGTEALPAVSATASTDTGIWFPAVDEIAVSTNAVERFRINATGSFGMGTTPNYGTSGMALKSAGDAAQSDWGWSGAVVIGNQAASGVSAVFSGLDLNLYKFIVLVADQVSHSAAGDRQMVFGADAVTADTSSGQSFNGFVVLHITSGIAFTCMGQAGGGNPYATGFVSSYTPASTNVAVALSGSGSFNGGNVYLLGIS